MGLIAIESRSLVHVIDMDSKYSAACFLSGASFRDIWEALLKILVNAHVGYLALIAVDQGLQFTNDECATVLVTHGIAMR